MIIYLFKKIDSVAAAVAHRRLGRRSGRRGVTDARFQANRFRYQLGCFHQHLVLTTCTFVQRANHLRHELGCFHQHLVLTTSTFVPRAGIIHVQVIVTELFFRTQSREILLSRAELCEEVNERKLKGRMWK